MVVAKYLNKEEAHELKVLLEEAGIQAIVREHGPSRWLLGGIYCQVQTARKDADKAQAIADKFTRELKASQSARNALLASECPECKSKEIDTQAKKSIFQKLFYVGVTLRKCHRCGYEWFT